MKHKKNPTGYVLFILFNKWSLEPESNWRPHPYHGCALPAELSRQRRELYRFSIQIQEKILQLVFLFVY